MTVQEYKRRLLDLEKRLSRHSSDEREQAREQVLDSARDAADDSVADEDESVDFAVAEIDTTVLEHIRGRIVVDRPTRKTSEEVGSAFVSELCRIHPQTLRQHGYLRGHAEADRCCGKSNVDVLRTGSSNAFDEAGMLRRREKG